MDTKKYGGLIALVVAMLMIVSYSIAPVRVGVGSALDVGLGPIVTSLSIPFIIVIIILSTLTAVYSSIIQKYTIDYERMQEVQERMKEFQREYREAQLSQDEKRIKKLDQKKERVMKEQMEMSQQQFKPMAYIMIITVPIFFWLLYRLASVNAVITMPFFGTHQITDIILAFVPCWIFWYMLCSLTISQVIRKALNIGGI